MKLRMIMLTALFVVLWGTAVTVGAADQTTGQAVTAAKAKAVFPALKYEFDSVVEGTQITHGFKIKNTGAGPLDIAKVKTG
jgi:hypothetical protein